MTDIIESVFVNETDFGNFLNNTTFMLRLIFIVSINYSNQRDLVNRVALKRTVGIKYINDTIATDFVYDTIGKAYSTSITCCVFFFLYNEL